MPNFTLDDLEQNISPVARDIICDLVLNRARFDSLVSQMVLLTFGLSIDGGTIPLGTMDTRSKLDRLKKLYNHHKMTEAAQHVANLSSWHKRYVDVRNAIAHHTCAGSWKSDPGMIVFAPVRARQDVLKEVEIEHIPLSYMVEAVTFAAKAADAIKEMVEPLTARSAIHPPEPPAFPPPSTPQNRERKGRLRSPKHSGV